MILLTEENYRPISLLSHFSKIYEKILFKQINDYIKPYFFRPPDRLSEKSQYVILLKKMIEKWKHLLDNGYNIAVLFMDLSKPFNVLKHPLLLAKLDAIDITLEYFLWTYQNHLTY